VQVRILPWQPNMKNEVFKKIDIAFHKILHGMNTKCIVSDLGHGHFAVKMIELEEQPCICNKNDCPEKA
jgi:hypothetical protein